MSGRTIVGEPGSCVESRKHRSNYTPLSSINFRVVDSAIADLKRITDNIFDKRRVISVISYQLSVISYQYLWLNPEA
ncbi:hypothetical protein [Dapis sp. BLCC M229]|uniref:hypothetical protein n=1 Tax=Dapis sp. BLCC M229 TaxID=3400188 RepID=UPI003CE6F706